MSYATTTEDISRESYPERAKGLCADGYRLVQMMGTQREKSIEIFVSFDKAYDLHNLRLQVPRDDLSLPSITGFSLGAFAYENELQDLFGIKVTDLAIDYQGKFLRAKVAHPLAGLVDPSAPVTEAAPSEKKSVQTVTLKGVKCETGANIDTPPTEEKA
jgi:ech hydrogenase subunit D